MRKIPSIALVAFVAMPLAASAQIRLESPITLRTTLQVQTAVIARYDSLTTYLQPTALEKLTTSATLLQKEVAGTTAPDIVVAHARAEVIRQFPRMTLEQQDRMTFLALTAAVQAAQTQRDSLGDLGSETSLKLQTYQDRYSKFMDMLSNLMKKQSETSSAIISNLK
jgi:hypothetical protein